MSNTTTIKIVDSGLDYYTVEPKKVVLGRMYDNDADEIQIIRPDTEQDSLCTMIITDMNGAAVDHIIMENDIWGIKNNVSQHKLIKIGFSFSKKDGYVKNSEIIVGEFLLAQKPDGFIPVEPEQKKNIDFLISYGFTDSKLNGNELEFYNMNGEKVVSFDLSPFTQEQSDFAETDTTKETFIKNKSTRFLKNEGSGNLIDGEFDIYTVKSYVDNEIKKIKNELTESKITNDFIDFTIETDNWEDLSDSETFKYSATIDSKYKIQTTGKVVYTLINDNPNNFATYGFALNEISFGSGDIIYLTPKFTFYAINKPSNMITLKVEITANTVELIISA